MGALAWIEQDVRRRAAELGLEIASVGVGDLVLPGDMKDLMNKATEAKKAAEANLIARREEVAAMRSRQPDADAIAGTGSSRKDRINRKPKRRPRREGPRRPVVNLL